MSRLTGKVAVVTGGSKGIGAGIARDFGTAGASVVIGYTNDERGAAETVAAIETGGGRAIAVQADVSNPEDVSRFFDEAVAQAGPVDVLVNNAGVYAFGPFEAITVDEYRRQYDINVLGPILTTQAFVEQIGDRGGAVINIVTSGLSDNSPGAALYLSTKGAVATLTRVLANELAPRGIRVNAIAAGATDTEGSRVHFDDEAFASVGASTPLGRIGHPDDIAPVATFLASGDAHWVTGETIFASGGLR